MAADVAPVPSLLLSVCSPREQNEEAAPRDCPGFGSAQAEPDVAAGLSEVKGTAHMKKESRNWPLAMSYTYILVAFFLFLPLGNLFFCL